MCHDSKGTEIIPFFFFFCSVRFPLYCHAPSYLLEGFVLPSVVLISLLNSCLTVPHISPPRKIGKHFRRIFQPKCSSPPPGLPCILMALSCRPALLPPTRHTNSNFLVSSVVHFNTCFQAGVVAVRVAVPAAPNESINPCVFQVQQITMMLSCRVMGRLITRCPHDLLRKVITCFVPATQLFYPQVQDNAPCS